jgi:hypothetical protein
MRAIARALAVALLATVLGAGAAAPAAAEPCATAWGSATRSAAVQGSAVRTIRTGTGACWDRVVLDLAGPVAGYHVTYVDEVTQGGSGAVMPVSGGAKLQVTLHHSGDAPAPTLPPADAVAGYPTLRSVVYAGDLEGATVGVGVRERLPFRVFTLTGPDRLVVDIAHRRR